MVDIKTKQNNPPTPQPEKQTCPHFPSSPFSSHQNHSTPSPDPQQQQADQVGDRPKLQSPSLLPPPPAVSFPVPTLLLQSAPAGATAPPTQHHSSIYLASSSTLSCTAAQPLDATPALFSWIVTRRRTDPVFSAVSVEARQPSLPACLLVLSSSEHGDLSVPHRHVAAVVSPGSHTHRHTCRDTVLPCHAM